LQTNGDEPVRAGGTQNTCILSVEVSMASIVVYALQSTPVYFFPKWLWGVIERDDPEYFDILFEGHI
jgi:hypothetical protein